ncbi:MAG: hypothetical protein KC416_12110 [Myxococcales bacterium]|nr:hypothetical protein [Myxococcales bacterium]
MRHHVVLIPGFFAFSDLGDLRYFLNVGERLQAELQSYGIEAEIHELKSLPTASIRQRAGQILDYLADLHADGEPVHLVGHSTGGLDARLAVTPTASLPSDFDSADAARMVESVVTVATPHHGTPLATYFGSAMGKPLLGLLAGMTILILRNGRLPIGFALKVGGLFLKADDIFGLDKTVVDQLYNELLANFTPERQQGVIDFFKKVTEDQSLLFQLMPASLDLFNATTADPSSVRYASVTARARRPKLAGIRGNGYDPYAQSMYLVYAALWLVASRTDPEAFAHLTVAQREELAEGYRSAVDHRDNDGIVPTFSQAWGPVIHTAFGDHLDVVGHYGQRRKVEGIYADWLPTTSQFDDDAFTALWGDVASFIAEG